MTHPNNCCVLFYMIWLSTALFGTCNGSYQQGEPPNNNLELPRVTLETFNNTYYFFHGILRGNRNECIAFCKSFGMQLLSIETEEENNFVASKAGEYLPSQSDQDIYTCGEKYGSGYLWEDTLKPLAYSKWMKGQPNSGTYDNIRSIVAVYMGSTRTVEWKLDTDQNQKYCICKLPIAKNQLVHYNLGQPVLPLEIFNNTYYFFHGILQGNRNQCMAFCKSFGMGLISIKSEQENSFIASKVIKYFPSHANEEIYTIGARYGDGFIWEDTLEPVGYTNWMPKEPDTYSSHHAIIAVLKDTTKTIEWMMDEDSKLRNCVCKSSWNNKY